MARLALSRLINSFYIDLCVHAAWYVPYCIISFPHTHLAHSSLRKVVRVEIPQSDVAALDNEVKEAHALKKNTIGGFDQINKTYRTIWKWWKNLRNVHSESQLNTYHYVGSRQIRQNDLYLLMYQDEVKVISELAVILSKVQIELQ